MSTIESRHLGRTAVRGGVITLAGQVIKVLLQLVGLVVLARLLDPADFGIVAMATAVVGVADILRDLGLSSAAIQAREITQQQKSNLFWINFAIGLLTAAACVAGSQALADFYDEARLGPVVVSIAICFLANGIQTQFQAELARNMRFLTLSITEIVSMSVGLGVAVAASVMHLGYWALVAQLVAQSLSLTIGRILTARWAPSWPRKTPGMRSLIRYGWNLMLTQLLVYVSSNIDSVLVGWRFGPQTLGLYNRAFQLLTLPLNQVFTPITNVALPVLSKLQDDASRFMDAIRRAQLTLGYGVVLMFALAFALADPLITIAFGDQWTGSVPIFRVLAVAGCFQAINYVAYWIFLATGQTGSHFRFSLISRTLLILCIVLGSIWGPLGIAVGYSAGVAIGWVAGLLWLNRYHRIATGPLFKVGLRIIAVGTAIASSSYLTWQALSGSGVVISIAASAGAAILALGVLCLIKLIRLDVKNVLSARRFLGRIRAA